MPDILLVKISSMGDVIHLMPAVADIRSRFPQARIAWAVEEGFAPLLRLHPGVSEVIPVAWRRWRHGLAEVAIWREMREASALLRGRRYDAVIDAQGLIHSAVIARLAHGRRHGLDRASVREPLAALLYQQRHPVARDLHAVERNRLLVGAAIGHRPEGPPDYGLTGLHRPGHQERPVAVLVHASHHAAKAWREDGWMRVGRRLAAEGFRVLLLSGTPAEHAVSSRLAGSIPGAAAPAPMPLDAVARQLAGAALVVAVDTGLLHLAAALTVPAVAIFTASDPALTRPIGSGRIDTLGSRGAPPPIEEVEAAVTRILAPVAVP